MIKIKQSKKIITQTIFFVLIAIPLQTESQLLPLEASTCEPNPYRKDNEMTSSPYDNISYYRCLSIADEYKSNQTDIQSRRTCEYTKVVYYDTSMRSWTNAEMSKTCKVKSYELNQKRDAIIPEGWHPPLRTR